MPICQSFFAWSGYENEDLGIDLPGYHIGDSIDLRLYSLSEGHELYVEATLDGSTYGETPLTSGTAVVLSSSATPMAYELMQNYPNPFNQSTSIVFSLPETGHISLNIYDISGRLVSTLVDGTLDNGAHSVMWDGTDNHGELVSAGVYIYALESADMMMTKKMILMK